MPAYSVGCTVSPAGSKRVVSLEACVGVDRATQYEQPLTKSLLAFAWEGVALAPDGSAPKRAVPQHLQQAAGVRRAAAAQVCISWTSGSQWLGPPAMLPR